MRIATDTDESAFNDAYWASKSPNVNKLRNMDWDGIGPNPRAEYGSFLALHGELIDVPIMVNQWSPYQLMKRRIEFGYTWVPSALMNPVELAPGLNFPGDIPPYDPTNIPAGAIKVSLDFDDYPVYQQPTREGHPVTPQGAKIDAPAQNIVGTAGIPSGESFGKV